jgi:simple sugar transport system ATP-binding protein
MSVQRSSAWRTPPEIWRHLRPENASFDLYPGEVHALVGENGAGKSTLCKLIAGVVAPSEGVLSVGGARSSPFFAPKDAQRHGISMVYQETSLVPQLTVAQNMVLGRERAFNSVRKVRNAARQVLQRLNFNVDSLATRRLAVGGQAANGGDWPAPSSMTRR